MRKKNNTRIFSHSGIVRVLSMIGKSMKLTKVLLDKSKNFLKYRITMPWDVQALENVILKRCQIYPVPDE